MRSLNQEILDLGRSMYDEASGWNDMERDKDGFIVLKPTAAHVDAKMSSLTTNIDNLEEKLKKYRAERERTEKITKTEEYKESKKKLSKKKAKKQKATLLEMVFNAADQEADEEDSDDEENGGTYRDKKDGKKKTATTLETTYGKRFSPVVSMLHDTITEFDRIAADIDQDLKESKNTARTMYRSSQINNLIAAKNAKLSAVKELASVATTLSNLEYKKEKDKQAAEGSGYSKEVASIASKYLRGADAFSYGGKKGKKKKDKDSKKKGSSDRYDDSDDDSDDPYGSIKKSNSRDDAADAENQKELAGEFAKSLMKHRDDISFTPWERNIQIEGTYHVAVLVDPTNLDDWKFIAISNTTGKEIPDFKDKYKDVLPKKKKCRMTFDLSKNRAVDKNSSKTYKLYYK